MKKGDLIFWKEDDRDEETNHFGIILYEEKLNNDDPKLKVHQIFHKKSDMEYVETFRVIWFHYPNGEWHHSTIHKDFAKEWYEVVSQIV